MGQVGRLGSGGGGGDQVQRSAREAGTQGGGQGSGWGMGQVGGRGQVGMSGEGKDQLEEAGVSWERQFSE